MGIMDRTKLLERRSAWRSVAMRKVATAPEAEAASRSRSRAARDRSRRIGFAVLLLLGAAVSMLGWWSLYGDLGLWGGVVGSVLMLVGGLGFDSAHWTHKARPLYGDGRQSFLTFLFVYAIGGTAATIFFAAICPATTDVRQINGREHTYDDWEGRFGNEGSFLDDVSCGKVQLLIFALCFVALLIASLYRSDIERKEDSEEEEGEGEGEGEGRCIAGDAQGEGARIAARCNQPPVTRTFTTDDESAQSCVARLHKCKLQSVFTRATHAIEHTTTSHERTARGAAHKIHVVLKLNLGWRQEPGARGTRT